MFNKNKKTPLIIPIELKKITQYIRRAEELDKDTTPQTRLVAYYCRQHAVQTGIPNATTPATRECLSIILNDLEKEKKAMSNFTKEEAYTICREFAFKVFDKADAVDRAGKSNKSTAKSFYAAASFLDVLNYFHKDQEGEEKSDEVIEEEKKSFYAKWKATDILKAIREGREVQPGGFDATSNGELGEQEKQDDGFTHNTPSAPKEEEGQDTTTIMPPPPPPPSYSSATTPSAPVVPVKPPPPEPSSGGGFMSSFFGGAMGGNNSNSSKYPKNVLDDAKELTKFALSALNDKDGDTAVERLQQAMEILVESQRGQA